MIADLSPEAAAAVAEADGPPPGRLSVEECLQAVFEAVPPYVFSAGGLRVLTDRRWFSALPAAGPGAPALELRRWPGDTVLAFYAVAGTLSSSAGRGPPIPGARLERADASDLGEEWQGTLETELGSRPVVWIERPVETASSHLGALLLPGDAGLGAAAVEGLLLEARATLERLEVIEAAWRHQEGLDPTKGIALPTMLEPPGEKLEAEEPWQVARTPRFTLGLPPGIRLRRVDDGVPPPGPAVPGGLLWLRGRFVDMEGTRVTVGDGERVGYVALAGAAAPDWPKGTEPPVAAPDAERLGVESFDLAARRTGARTVTAARWRQPAFEGEWLVFRLAFEEESVEIGLPLLEGRRAPSLFWIPLTWRGPGLAPAPPPVDPSERFGIRFDRLTPAERKRQPWTEGVLEAPGLTVEMPLGWLPAASLRTRDGFPVRLLGPQGNTAGLLVRVAAEQMPDLEGDAGWRRLERGGGRGVTAWARDDQTHLFVGRDGHGYRFELRVKDGRTQESWERLIGSVRLMRSGS